MSRMFKRLALSSLMLLYLASGCANQAVQPTPEPPTTVENNSSTAVVETPKPTTTVALLPPPKAIPTQTMPAGLLAKPQLSEFIVTFWWPPAITQANLQQIADGGYNLVMIYPIAPSYGLKVLNWAQELGLKVMLTDPNISPYRVNLEADIKEITDAYKNHPALWGYYIIDEPSANQFTDLAKLHSLLLQDDPLHFPYINLFPNYAVASN